MARRVNSLFAFGAASSISACSFTSSLDDLQRDGSANDAEAVERGESSAGGGGGDGAGPAGGAAGAPGGAPGGGGAMAGACAAGGGVFCDDFEGAQVGSFWSSTLVAGPGVSLAAEGAGRGSVRALRASAAAAAGASERVAMLRQSFGGATSVRCEVDVLVESYGGEDVGLVAFDLVEAGLPRARVSFGLRGGGALLTSVSLSGSGSSSQGASFDAPPDGRWVRVTLEVAPTGARVFYDASEVVRLSNRLAAGGEPQLALGITSARATGALAFLYDNVLCTLP